MMVERRKLMRFSAFLDIACKEWGESKQKIKCRSKNVNAEGLAVYGSKSLNKGALVEIAIKVPGDKKLIVTLSEVIWVRHISESVYDAGLRFTALARDDKQTLLEFIYDELNKQ